MSALACCLLLGCYQQHAREGGGCSLPTVQVCCAPGGAAVAPAPGVCRCPAGTEQVFREDCAPTPSGPDAGPLPPPPSDAGPPPPSDAGPPPPPLDADVPTPADGGSPIPDGGLTCPAHRAAASCRDRPFVPPGQAFELPVQFDTCGCCPTAECAASVDHPGQTLRLSTALCPDPCDCDTCQSPRASCAIPPLTEGIWDVVVNGAPAFQLPVFAETPGGEPAPVCDSFAEPDVCRSSDDWPSEQPWEPDAVCVQARGADVERVELRLLSDCWPCGDLQGPCPVIVEPRFTDDLPPGGEIRFLAGRFGTECDIDCPAICQRAERSCVVPPLVPGNFYRIWSGSEVAAAFTAGEPLPPCPAEP